MFASRYRKDLEAGISPNPDLSVPGRAKFDFTVNKKLPRGVKSFGYVRHVRQPDGSRALRIDKKSYLQIDLKMFTPNGGGISRLNQCVSCSAVARAVVSCSLYFRYTLILNFRYARHPRRLQTLFRTAAPTSNDFAHEVTIDREGSLGINNNNSAGFGQLGPQKWLWVAFVYAGGSNVQCFVDGTENQ